VAQPVHGVLVDAAGTRASTKRHAGTIKAADPANTANATDMRGAKAGDRANATNVSAAAEGANVSTATEAAAHVGPTSEAAAHSASVTAAASAAPRLGLYNAKARSQQSRRQNRHRFSHRLLHSVIGMVRATSWCAASDELEIGILPRSTIKMTFKQFTLSSRKSTTSGQSQTHSYASPGLRHDDT
jgi:hypothetical protein